MPEASKVTWNRRIPLGIVSNDTFARIQSLVLSGKLAGTISGPPCRTSSLARHGISPTHSMGLAAHHCGRDRANPSQHLDASHAAAMSCMSLAHASEWNLMITNSSNDGHEDMLRCLLPNDKPRKATNKQHRVPHVSLHSFHRASS